MIKFIDLETGNTFNGSLPYKFWFDHGLGVNLIYSKPICFITGKETPIKVSIEENNVFQLANLSGVDLKADSIDYNNIKTYTVESVGTKYRGYCVHIIYVLASAKQAGEYLTTINIDGENFWVGADFYSENESLYINLSNNGIEIPESIQKAIYGVNVHEDKRDNITLNRKWKELLSNYWDVVANKGSYKSLFNSLKWFEYGDMITLKEIWKMEGGAYTAKDVKSILSDKYAESLNGFAKTTYFGIYYALEQVVREDGELVWDEEGNPKLSSIANQWSMQDLSLKLCLLGHFYKTYFMPIHLDLIHSTIEDVVYTNTFKIRQGSTCNRFDFIFSCDDIECNVHDGDAFRLDKVQCYVGPNTLFGSKQGEIIGVQKEDPFEELHSNDDWRQYVSQLYNEIGAIVDFEIKVPISEQDSIKRETLVLKNLTDNTLKTFTDYKVIGGDVKFCLLIPTEGEYEVRLQFDTRDGDVFVKKVRFSIVDTTQTSLKLYKVIHKDNLTEDLLSKPSEINDYVFSRKKGGTRTTQFIKGIISEEAVNGVRLSHMLILKSEMSSLKDKYFELVRKTKQNTYYIYISKAFMKDVQVTIDPNNIYREDYIFVPEFHELVEFGQGNNVDDYTITDRDTLCVSSDISYGKYIKECDWEIRNDSKPTSSPILIDSTKEPFIAPTTKSPFEPGYYSVSLRYKLTSDDQFNTMSLNSAFRKI